ncbi:MAG: DsbA family protein [Deinococcota bacterium]
MTRLQQLTLGTLAALIVSSLGFLTYTLLFSGGNDLSEAAYNSYANQPTLGQDTAPVKLIMFENFLCDHCKTFEEEVFPQLKRDYVDTGKVELYYINLAWGSERARLAGLAGECAYQQDENAFWDYKTALYAAQATWQDVTDLATLAMIDGLDADALRRCVEDERYQDEVQRDLDLATRIGVQATPSLVLGNQGFEAPSYGVLKRAIDAQLSEG